MSLPPLSDWRDIHRRLSIVFPVGAPNREHAVWEIAARTLFVMLYTGAVDGRGYWIRPDQVSRMTDAQAALTSDEDRMAWTRLSTAPGRGDIPGRWYAVNTRESIRDDTIRFSLIPNCAVVERHGLPVTSSLGRYALQAEFAALFDPKLEGEALAAEAQAWRTTHLNAGALARIAINRRGAVEAGERVLVRFPNGETRSMAPGPSADITRAVVEVFAPTFLERPGVIWLSDSGAKVVARDDELAKAIGLRIPPEKSLPDALLVDLGPAHPMLVFVEVVASDGPVNEVRKEALLRITAEAGFSPEHVAFVTAYLDRGGQPFKRTVQSLAWGTYAWFAAEPERLVEFAAAPRRLQ